MSRQILDAVAEELLAQGGRQGVGLQAAFLETVGNTYENLALHEDARRYLEQALRLRERQGDPLAIAGTWTFLGDVDFQLGRYRLSRSAYQRAIALRERFPGKAALPLVTDWNGLGNLAIEEGQLVVAGRYFAKSLAVSRAAEDGQRELAETLLGLGRLAVLHHKFDRAQVRFEMAWRYLRSTLGAYDLDTVDAQSDLAYALENRGDYASAEILYQEIVDMHPDLPRVLLDLAIAQRRVGHLVEARASLDEELRIRREHRLPADEGEAASWDYLGHVGLDQNQLDAAEAAFQKSLATYRSLPGDRRLDLARILTNLAQVRRRRADLAGALTFARQSLELTRAAEGEKGPSFAEGLERVGELLQQDRQFRSAEVDYRQAMTLLSRSTWKDRPEKARIAIGLGSLLVETGRAGEARPLLEDGLRIRSKALPVGDPDTARAESELGACYAALGDRGAEALLRNGYQVLLTRWGPNHPDTRQAQDRLRRLGGPAR
jgi:tetratricopeptide (TPR) repeat protein